MNIPRRLDRYKQYEKQQQQQQNRDEKIKLETTQTSMPGAR